LATIDHAQSGAVMAFRLLDKMGMKAEEISRIVTAIGNHGEKTAFPANEIAAALILADKSDVRRSRLCMFLLQKAHIGEVQSSVWPQSEIDCCKEHGIQLL